MILYGLLRGQDPDHYEIRMPFLVYGMILFGHGVLIYRCRELEEKRLLFYRGLPVSLIRRFGQVAGLYFGLLMPEICIIGWLTPVNLHWLDAIGFIVSGYGLLLLLNSLLYVAPLKTGDFLKLSGGIFGILYLGVLGDVLIPMGCFFVVLAGCLFLGGYWRYQR